MKQTQTQTYNSIGRIPLSIRRFAGTLNIDETIRDIIQYIRNGNDFDQYGRVFFIQPTPEQEVSEPSIQAQRSLEETIQYGEEGEDETTLGETIPGTVSIALEEETETKQEETTGTIQQTTPAKPKTQISIKIPQKSITQSIQPQQQITPEETTMYETILTDAFRYIINIPSFSTAEREPYEPVIFRFFIDRFIPSKPMIEEKFEKLFEDLFVLREENERKLIEKRFRQIVAMHPYTIKLMTQRNMTFEEILTNVMKMGKGKKARITIYAVFIPQIIKKPPISEPIMTVFDIEFLPLIEQTVNRPSPSGGTGGQATTQGQTRQFRTIKTPPSQHPYRRIGGTPDFFTP